MMAVKIIFMVLMVGGFTGAMYRGCEENDWRGFWHNALVFILFIVLVANREFF